MEPYETRDMRNIAFVGHGASGKTSLLEVALHEVGATKRLGSVDEGTSVSDFDPEEKERHFSVDSSLFHFHWQGREVNVIDTPGYPDFVQGVISSLSVVETAIIVVSATSGIQVNTQKIWNMAGVAGLARMIIITKMDDEKGDFPGLLHSLQETFGQECMPLVLPVGCGAGFKGVVNLLNLPDHVPVDMSAAVDEQREKLVEGIVSVCDEQLERYLDGQKIEIGKLEGCFRTAIASGGIVPVFCCENREGCGVREIIDAITKFAPSPEKDLLRKCSGDTTRERGESGVKNRPFSAQVFKSVTDPFVGKLSFFRVYSGTLEKHPTVFNVRTQKSEKIGHLFKTCGKVQQEIDFAVPGDLIAISKIEDISVSDTLCDPQHIVRFDDIKFPNPMVSLALKPKSHGAEQKISETLHRLVEEDRTCKVSRDAQTHELVITGMSNLHLEVLLSRLKKRFHIEVETSPPKIPYKETITSHADAQYKHKKQTGGKGQYGEVYVRIEPLRRGGGFEFESEIVGGAIPGQYIPAAEKGIRETLEKGILSGNHIVDVKVVLFDGSFHNVDSSEAAFKIAASKAFHRAFQKANPVLLEPIVDMEITIPSECMGDVTGNIASRRGRVLGMDSLGDLQMVKVGISLAEVTNYEAELKSMTHGRGSYTMEFSHYDVVPPHLAQEIIAQAQKGDEPAA